MNKELKTHLIANHSYKVDKNGVRLEKPNCNKDEYQCHFERQEALCECTAYNTAKTVVELPTLADFIQSIRQNSDGSPFEDEQKEIDTKELYLIYEYENWIRRPLTLSMFVSVKDGKVLEEPEQYIGALEFAEGKDYEKALAYQTALNNVLFEGWEIYYQTLNECVLRSTLDSNTISFCLVDNTWNEFKQISDLLPFGLKLKQ